MARKSPIPNPDFNVEVWAGAYTSKVSKCQTCRLDPRIGGAIETYATMIREKKTRAPLSAFYAVLCEEMGYPFTVESLRRHIAVCLK